MQMYEIVFSARAENDIQNLADVIIFQYKAPITAFRYVQGLLDTIKQLSYNAEAFRIQTSAGFNIYGPCPRRINYKNMTIIYNVVNQVVYIQRVIPSKNI